MKQIFIPCSLLLSIGLLLCFIGCNDRLPANHGVISKCEDTVQIKSTASNNDFYLRTLDRWLKMTPEQLGIPLPAEKTGVYGVVMDINHVDFPKVFVAYKNGYADLCTKRSIFIGKRGLYGKVVEDVILFVDSSSLYLSKMERIDTLPSPAPGFVHFYLLTNRGLYFAEEKIKNLETLNSSSQWHKFYMSGNLLIDKTIHTF